MNRNRKDVELVQNAIRQRCVFLHPDPFLAQRVLSSANEQRAVKAKKLSRGLVIALTLVLMTATAVAVSLTHGREMVQRFVEGIARDDGSGQQPDEELGLPFADITPDAPAASKGALCSHENASTKWIRRYVPLGPGGHQLVDTYYHMCYSCGRVFWVHDALLMRETHDDEMVTDALRARGKDGHDYLTCKYCHALWYAPNEENR